MTEEKELQETLSIVLKPRGQKGGALPLPKSSQADLFEPKYFMKEKFRTTNLEFLKEYEAWLNKIQSIGDNLKSKGLFFKENRWKELIRFPNGPGFPSLLKIIKKNAMVLENAFIILKGESDRLVNTWLGALGLIGRWLQATNRKTRDYSRI